MYSVNWASAGLWTECSRHRPDFGTWLLAQPTNQQASVPHSRSWSNANTSSHTRPVVGINTVSHSQGTNTISHSQSINANTSLHMRPAATTHQQPVLTTSTADTHHQPTLHHQRTPHYQQQAVPQTESASVMYNTHTSLNPSNNLSPDSDSTHPPDSSDPDISDIGAEPVTVNIAPIHFHSYMTPCCREHSVHSLAEAYIMEYVKSPVVRMLEQSSPPISNNTRSNPTLSHAL
ncbi:hypothetical protein EDB19DRAFT_1919186 [Suillus lakei]|nr:hypothetical protein EDB19DRAFT_1919186 [Suillus lakei]